MIQFTVVRVGEKPFDIVADSRDVLLWEKTGRNVTFTSLMSDIKMTEMYRLAYTACKRQGRFAGTLAEFEELHQLKFEEEDEPDPTPPVRLRRRASRSPSEPESRPASGPTKENEPS